MLLRRILSTKRKSTFGIYQARNCIRKSVSITNTDFYRITKLFYERKLQVYVTEKEKKFTVSLVPGSHYLTIDVVGEIITIKNHTKEDNDIFTKTFLINNSESELISFIDALSTNFCQPYHESKIKRYERLSIGEYTFETVLKISLILISVLLVTLIVQIVINYQVIIDIFKNFESYRLIFRVLLISSIMINIVLYPEMYVLVCFLFIIIIRTNEKDM